MNAPKVFVSHASEDKERFVLEFARQLRANGIDAWLDKWEMLPGDSLVDKIFEQGLKDAQAVIVVLSRTSVQKPWVREELNAAVVKRINTGSKLIPVVIDECEVPEALKHTLWESMKDSASYSTGLKRIVASVFGVTDRPPLGSAPPYAKAFVESIGGLNNIDSLVLRVSCEAALAGSSDFIDPNVTFKRDDGLLLPESELEDSLEMLDRAGHIEMFRTISPGLQDYRVKPTGFEVYARACITGYDQMVASVVSAIVNKKCETNTTIAEAINDSEFLVDHILDVLALHGHLKASKTIGGITYILEVSPALRRVLRAG